MIFYVILCLISLFVVVLSCRRGGSLGLPLAYILALLLIHLPGALIHLYDPHPFSPRFTSTSRGIQIASFAALSFAVGVWIVGRSYRRITTLPIQQPQSLLLFCVMMGWLSIAFYPIVSGTATVSALVAKSGPLWIIGAAFGLRQAVLNKELTKAATWGLAILLFPAFTLLGTGFLAVAALATLVVVAPSLLLIRRLWLSFASFCAGSFLSISLFVTYFVSRDQIRDVVWRGGGLEARLASVSEVAQNLEFLDLGNPEHLSAIDQRLNQNYFIGIAADRIQDGYADYLYGQSLIDGILALIPRVLWPNKPVTAGSGDLVRNATGMWSELSDTTSWGVGVVMEFYLNFGWLGITAGMLALGYSLAKLDRHIYSVAARGGHSRLIPAYLVGIALIFPEGSFVDVIGGAGAALAVGIIWGKVYSSMTQRRTSRVRVRTG